MLLDDTTSELIKDFIIQKLDGRDAEADSDILADYCLALLKSNDVPDAALKTSVAENLKDFLPERYESFTNELFNAIATKSYDPSRPTQKTTVQSDNSSIGRYNVFESRDKQEQGLKRTYDDSEIKENQGQSNSPWLNSGSSRPNKQARRVGRSGRTERRGWAAQPPLSTMHDSRSQNDHPSLPTTSSLSAIPNSFSGSPAGFPNMNTSPSDSAAAMQMMQQMMSMMAKMVEASSSMQKKSLKRRCRDYDMKGYCTRGASCPYEHGSNRYVVPSTNGKYDPDSTLLNIHPIESGSGDARAPVRRRAGNDREKGQLKVRKRSEMVHTGPNFDKRVSSIIVEAIPEEHFQEHLVRDFFTQFGNVDNVKMQSHRRIAVITFDEHEAAMAAYESPKVVFDNRFVKVYWANSENTQPRSIGSNSAFSALNGLDTDANTATEDKQIDVEELTQKQEEAQRRYEDQKKLREAANEQKAELDTKLKLMEAERQELVTLLAKRNGQGKLSPMTDVDHEHTRSLKVQLAKLEAEAKSLGIEPDAVADFSSNNAYHYGLSPYRGRGGYRGRGRGRGTHLHYRGGLGAYSSKPFSGVKKLDNRPKAVMVVFQSDDYETSEELLRQHLLFGHEPASLVKHPSRNDAAIVTFEQRYQAENFLAEASTSDTLGGGKTEMMWYTTSSGVDAMDEKGDEDQKLQMSYDHSEVREMRDLDTYDDDIG